MSYQDPSVDAAVLIIVLVNPQCDLGYLFLEDYTTL